jgi:hypothetical protein
LKKGLLIWKAPKRRKNIGDYIQSLAAEQYTGRDVVFVEREETHKYSGEPIKMIMNGWFMHHPENWPPSEAIVPLFISIHINPAIGERMLSEKSVAYFKNYVKNNGPVGARDRDTEKQLKAKGIDAYFSSCLTLTLGKTYQHNPLGETVCFVDPHYDVNLSPRSTAYWKYCSILMLKPKTIVAISIKMHGSVSRKSLLKTAAFYKAYSQYFTDEILMKAQYIQHLVVENHFANEIAKFDYARNLMHKYENSRLVVTSRIHAALPCLAMGTPVIFVISDDLQPDGKGLVPEAKGRFDGLLELFHVMECVDNKMKPILGFKVGKKIDLNHTIRNKDNHLKMVEELDKCCINFIENVSNLPSLDSSKKDEAMY